MFGMFDQTAQELLIRQRLREASAELERDRIARELAPDRPGLRASVASTLVRWGLRLDREAVERALEVRPRRVASEGRR